MNVYPCCYRGSLGYGCRIRGRRWMFVPEFGQPDRDVHRDLSIGDLRFANPVAQSFERNREAPALRRGLGRWLRDLPIDRGSPGPGRLLLTGA